MGFSGRGMLSDHRGIFFLYQSQKKRAQEPFIETFLDRFARLWPVCGAAGRYSYSIYVMQQISFYILGRTFWKNTSFLYEHVYFSLLISTLFSMLIGILTYYLVEQPCLRVYKRWKTGRISQES